MKLELEIREAFGALASEVRPGPPSLERAVGRAGRRARDRRFAFGTLAVALLAAVAIVAPRLLVDKPSRLVVLDPAPNVTFSSSSDPLAISGLSVEMTLPPGAATAEVVEATVRIRDDAGGVTHVAVLWGETPGQFGGLVVDCVATEPAPSSEETRTLRHSYRSPGTYSIRVQIMTGHCQDTEIETVEVQGKVSISQGATPSNGPLPPTVHIEDRRNLNEGRPPLEAWFYLGGGDEDGFVHRVVVDWGDGTSATLVDAPISACEEPSGQWPSTYLDGAEVHHPYAPGTYTLTVTVTSSGCAGLDVQTESETFELVSPS